MSEAKTGTSCPSDPRRCRGVRETHDNVRWLGTGWCAGRTSGPRRWASHYAPLVAYMDVGTWDSSGTKSRVRRAKPALLLKFGCRPKLAIARLSRGLETAFSTKDSYPLRCIQLLRRPHPNIFLVSLSDVRIRCVHRFAKAGSGLRPQHRS